jgi:N-acetylglucosaminyl-diphospho-decaprenol L-rhamnosyltransferase
MTKTLDCSIIIPVYNRWSYTRDCLENISGSDAQTAEIIVIDNGSTDETKAGLLSFREVKVLTNSTNEGCAKAWNAGLKASSQTKWKIFLNNDVLLPRWALSGLIDAGEKWGLGVVCPAMRQGKIDYDFDSLSSKVRRELANEPRMGFLHGVCFCVRNDVFEKVGQFDENFLLGQYEDTDFFRRVRLAKFLSGTVSDSFLHHFGSLTQLALRDEGELDYARGNKLYFRKKWNLGWLKRKVEKMQLLAQIQRMEARERQIAGVLMVQ